MTGPRKENEQKGTGYSREGFFAALRMTWCAPCHSERSEESLAQVSQVPFLRTLFDYGPELPPLPGAGAPGTLLAGAAAGNTEAGGRFDGSVSIF